MWVLGRWGSQLPTSIPYPATVFPTRIGFEGWVCLLLSSWKPGVCVCVCERERERGIQGFLVWGGVGDIEASLVAQMVKNPPAMQEIPV